MNTIQTVEKSYHTITGKIPTSLPEKELHLGGVPIGGSENCTGLKYSLWDGIFSNAMLALVETFSVAAAVYLHAPPLAISLLGSLPLFLSSIGQLSIPHLLDLSKGRKFYVLKGTLSQSLFLFLLGFTGWFSPSIRPWVYVIIFCLYGFSGNVISGLWITWVGDMVPSAVRGRHFAWRNRFFSATQLLCALVAGLLSRKFTTDSAPWIFFACVFFSASIFRLISSFMLFCQYEPHRSISKHSFSLLSDLKAGQSFLFYSVSAALMQGAVALSGPFFNVWYVRDLKFNYFSLSVASAATIIGTIISLPFWGKLADSLGNRRVILWTGFLVSTVPIPYIFSSYSWQICFLNFYSGLCWSGYNLSNFNYLLTLAGEDKPERKISISAAITGLSVFFCSLLGGYLSTRLPHLLGWQLKSLFLLSAIFRFAVYGFLFVRFPAYGTDKLSSLEIFHQIPGYRVGMGVLRNAFRAFRRI